jgi:hypothetical protein
VDSGTEWLGERRPDLGGGWSTVAMMEATGTKPMAKTMACGAFRRARGVGVVLAALLPSIVRADARADESKPAPLAVRGSIEGIDRLTLDNGIRVVLVRTSGATELAVTEAFGAVSELPDDLPRSALVPVLRASEAFGRGDLEPAARAELFSRRSIRETHAVVGDTATRTLTVPAGELPLAAYLVGQAQRPLRIRIGARAGESAEERLAPLLAGARPTLGFDPGGGWPQPIGQAEGEGFPSGGRKAASTPPSVAELGAVDEALRRGPLVVVAVGDLDSDRSTALLHKYLDDAEARRGEGPAIRAKRAPDADAAPLLAPALARTGAGHAVGLAVHVVGTPAERRALRAAFEAFLQGSIGSAGRKSGSLTGWRAATVLDEDRGASRWVGVRLVTSDAGAAARLEKELRKRWERAIVDGPSAAALEAADARVQGRDAAAWTDPAALARHVALVELAGERWGSPAFTAGAQEPLVPARVTPLLAAGFSAKHTTLWVERPLP